MIYFVCQCFALKASQLEGLTWIKKLLNGFFVVFLIVDTTFVVLQWIAIFDNKVINKPLCKTTAFVLPELFNLLISLMFIGIGVKIQQLADS